MVAFSQRYTGAFIGAAIALNLTVMLGIMGWVWSRPAKAINVAEDDSPRIVAIEVPEEKPQLRPVVDSQEADKAPAEQPVADTPKPTEKAPEEKPVVDTVKEPVKAPAEEKDRGNVAAKENKVKLTPVEMLAAKVKEAKLTYGGKEVVCSMDMLQAVIDIGDPELVKKYGFAGLWVPAATSTLPIRASMGTDTRYISTRGGYALFVSKQSGSGLALEERKERLVLSFPFEEEGYGAPVIIQGDLEKYPEGCDYQAGVAPGVIAVFCK